MDELREIKCVTINAYSKEEAIKQAGFNGQFHDCTITWKRNGQPLEGEAFDNFIQEQVKKWAKYEKDFACLITLEPGIINKKTNPCVIKNVINKQGRRHYVKTILVTDSDGRIVLQSAAKKGEVRNMMRDLYAKGLVKTDLKAQYVYLCDDGEKYALEATYEPSKNSRVGKYIVFSVE